MGCRMHHGGPAAPTDPFPATPRAATVRKATPDEAAAAAARPLPVVLLAVGLGIVVLVALVAFEPGTSPLWASVGPPSLVVAAAVAVSVVRNRRRAVAQAASERALAAGGPHQPVVLETQWHGRPSKVQNQVLVRCADTGTVAGRVRMVIKEDQFDPRGRLWLYGPAEAGAAVALVPGDERRPLLTSAPFETIEVMVPIDVHPCSGSINDLLGWAGDRAVVPGGPDGTLRPVPSSPLPPDLAAVSERVLRRQARAATSILVSFWLLLWSCIALRPDLAVSIAMTAAVFGGGRLFVRFGLGWVHRPLVQALERQGYGGADARFVARALVGARFGLALPAVRGAVAAGAVVPPPAGDGPPPPGWGVAPDSAPAPPPPSAPTEAFGLTATDDPRRVAIILAVVVVAIVVLLAVLAGSPQ